MPLFVADCICLMGLVDKVLFLTDDSKVSPINADHSLLFCSPSYMPKQVCWHKKNDA